MLLGDTCVGIAAVSDHCAEKLTVRFCDPRLATHRDVRYTRSAGETIWTVVSADADEANLPRKALIVPEELVPLRLAKTRTRFREHLLRRMHSCHKVLGNLVLFKCVVCKNRFPTFHPTVLPEMALDVFASYPHRVHEWRT